MTQKREIEDEIKKVRCGCNDCCLRNTCIIAYAVGLIVERFANDYVVMDTILSLCRGRLLCSYWHPDDDEAE